MGNTSRPKSLKVKSKDHPHIHGEYKLKSTIPTARSGSPPHTWGIQTAALIVAITVRITPTYMGNTRGERHGKGEREDHPHIHGEYFLFAFFLKTIAGSPPHTWGIRAIAVLKVMELRITPTYMGNTTFSKSGSVRP